MTQIPKLTRGEISIIEKEAIQEYFPEDDLSGLTSRKRKTSINDPDEELVDSDEIQEFGYSDFGGKTSEIEGSRKRRNSSVDIDGSLTLK